MMLAPDTIALLDLLAGKGMRSAYLEALILADAHQKGLLPA